jgi:hypothetical protein
VSALAAGKSRLDAVFERRPGGWRIELRPAGPPLLLELRPMIPPGARGVSARLDGRSVPASPVVSVALAGSPRVVELRWTGGLDIEPPLADLEPGRADQATRVLDWTAVDGGFRLEVEGLSGTRTILRLHGERPTSADSGVLRSVPSRPGVSELEVTFPASAERFSRASIRLQRP